MKTVLSLGVIGAVAGLVLMAVLKLVLLLTGNTAYHLLFNFDYVPWINALKPVWLFGYVFHFVTCIISVIALYYILKIWGFQQKIAPYIVVYTLGGGALYFLTGLSPQLPEVNDTMAWVYWTVAHGVFGISVGGLVRLWRKNKRFSE